MSDQLLVKAREIQRELDCDFTRAFQLATGRLQIVSATNKEPRPKDKGAELLAIAKKIQAQKGVGFHQAWCEAARLNPELLKPEPTKEEVSAQNAAAELYQRRSICAENIMERERCEFAYAWAKACELNPSPVAPLKKGKQQLLSAEEASSAETPPLIHS